MQSQLKLIKLDLIIDPLQCIAIDCHVFLCGYGRTDRQTFRQTGRQPDRQKLEKMIKQFAITDGGHIRSNKSDGLRVG